MLLLHALRFLVAIEDINQTLTKATTSEKGQLANEANYI